MEVQILQKWSNLLLDTGKGNRLVNFKPSKMTLELIFPDIREIFKKIELDAKFRVCDAPIAIQNEGEQVDSEDDWYMVEELPKDRRSKVVRQSREQYTENNLKLAKKIRENCVLVYNDQADPLPVIQGIKKKGMAAIEETGVNILQFLTTVDFAELKEYAEKWNTLYTESTFWFDIGFVVFAILIAVVVLSIINLVWKRQVMKEEAMLIKEGLEG